MKYQYTVIVGNIGSIQFTNKQDAITCYNDYAQQSTNKIGSASGETVALFFGNEIMMEHIGDLEEID